MKPTSTQKEVIEASKRLISCWLNTNNINSSSHINMIKNEINTFNNIKVEERNMLIHNLIDLLITIKYLSV